MLELTGFDVVLRGIGVLYWLLAIGAISLAIWLSESLTRKIVWAAVAAIVFGFWPAKMLIEHARHQAYAREAWAYFKKKCATEAGEKIYKTFTGVKSVLVVKPLPPATEKDLYDQFWYGDPYSDATPWNKRGEAAALMLASRTAPIADGVAGKGYEFVEFPSGSRNEVIRLFYPDESGKHQTSIIRDKPQSQFAVLWEDTSSPEDRQYWVAASRLRIINLRDKAIIAERVGYLIEAGFGSTAGQRRPWLSARGVGPNPRSCPYAHDYSDRWFLLKVLKPEIGASNGK